jgi:hypothetical protein
LPKISQQDDDGHTQTAHHHSAINNFEPIVHDHEFCERAVINVSYPSIKILFIFNWALVNNNLVGELIKLSAMFRKC